MTDMISEMRHHVLRSLVIRRRLSILTLTLWSHNLRVSLLVPSRLFRKLAVHPQLRLRHPSPRPHESPDKAKDDYGADSNPDRVRGHIAPPTNLLVIEKPIHVEPLRRDRHKRQTQVRRQYDEQPHEMHPEHGLRSRQHNLKQRKGTINPMLAHILPHDKRVAIRPPIFSAQRPPPEQHGPIDHGDEEGERDDGGVVQCVQGLQRPRQSFEEGAAAERVGTGVQGGYEEVER